MEKVSKLLFTAAASAMLFTSCQKCTTCKVTHTNSGVVMNNDGEYCGTAQDIKDYKDGLNSSYPSSEYTVNCTDK